MKILVITLLLAWVTSATADNASETSARRVPVLRSGTCTITLLEADGIRPISGALLTLTDATEGDVIVSATANNAGVCRIEVAEGRYILNVNERAITVIDAAENGDLDWARIVVSDSPMLVGGLETAAGTETARGTFSFLGLQGAQGAAAALVTGAAVIGGGYAIYDNNRSSDDDEDDDEVVLPPEDDDPDPLPLPVSP